MKQKIKTCIRKNIYVEIVSYILQNKFLYKAFNTSGEGNFEKTADGLFRHADGIVGQYMNNYHGDLSGKCILEIGTGVSTATAYLLAGKTGARKVYTYDRFCCLHKNNRKVLEKYRLIEIGDRVEYFYGPANLLRERVPSKSINYIVSNAVLEHVNTLEELVSNMCAVLSDDGVMYHRVDLRCHNRFKRKGELYFHTFSEKLWNMMGNKIGHPNRLLLKDYLRIFAENKLACRLINMSYFDENVLNEAEMYLGGVNIQDYAVSTFDVMLRKDDAGGDGA